MMKRIEANTLEEAYSIASKELNCSITNLEIEVIQNPNSGFLGMFKKKAVIVASCIEVVETPEEKPKQEEIKEEKVEEKHFSKPTYNREERVEKKVQTTPKVETPKVEPKEEIKEYSEPIKSEPIAVEEPLANKSILDNFYSEKRSIDDIAVEIEDELNRLFSFGCFDIDKVEVKKDAESENTVLVKFDGKDAALLIGKEGYRYKAISYMLFNWINPKYGLMIRLEIAEFLKNQEDMIKNYLAPLIEDIKAHGYGQTKPLDGVLSHIALKELRETFPNKYVVTKTNEDGVKYVVVNDFKKNY